MNNTPLEHAVIKANFTLNKMKLNLKVNRRINRGTKGTLYLWLYKTGGIAEFSSSLFQKRIKIDHDTWREELRAVQELVELGKGYHNENKK